MDVGLNGPSASVHRPAPWWASLPVQWHARHVLKIWLGVRVLVIITVALSAALSPPGLVRESLMAMSMSAGAVFVSLIVVVLATEVDRRRIGAPLLYANLGYSARWTALTTLLLSMGAEALLQVAVRVWSMSQ